MERTDSTAAMASLVAMYDERSDDEDKKDDPSPSVATVDDISDDDGDGEDRNSSNHSSRPPSRPSSRPMLVDENSVSSNPDQPPPLKRNGNRTCPLIMFILFLVYSFTRKSFDVNFLFQILWHVWTWDSYHSLH